MAKEKVVPNKKAKNDKAEKPAITSPKKPRPRGEKPDYGIGQKTEIVDYYCRSISQLLNGSFDKELYKIDNAIGMSKRMAPLYFGATEDILHIVADDIPQSHRLALAGVKPGTMIPFFQVEKPVFSSQSKDVAIRNAKKNLHTFLRKIWKDEVPNDILDSKVSSQTPSKIPEPEDVKASGVEALKIIWDGNETEKTFVEIDGVIFRIEPKKIGEGAAYSYNVIYVHHAPYSYDMEETDKIFDLSGSRTFLNVGKLQGRNFVSTQMLDENGKEIQRRIWQFLRVRLEKAGIATKEVSQDRKKATPNTTAKYVDDKDMDMFWEKAGSDANKEVLRAINGLEAFWRIGESPSKGVIFQIVRPKLNSEYILYPLSVGCESVLANKLKHCRIITSTNGKLPESAEMGKNASEKAVLRFIFDSGRSFMDAVHSNRKLLWEKLQEEKIAYAKKLASKIATESGATAPGFESKIIGLIGNNNETKACQNQKQAVSVPPSQVGVRKDAIQMAIDSYLLREDHIGLAKFLQNLVVNEGEVKLA